MEGLRKLPRSHSQRWAGLGFELGQPGSEPLPPSGMGLPGEKDGVVFPLSPFWSEVVCLGLLCCGGKRQDPLHLLASPRLPQPCPPSPGQLCPFVAVTSTLLLLPLLPGQYTLSPAVNIWTPLELLQGSACPSLPGSEPRIRER